MRVLIVVIGFAAVVMVAQVDYSAAPVTSPVWFGQPAVGSSPPPHWIPKRPGHYTLTDWQHVIDSTWGPGLPVDTELVVFDTFWNLIDDSFACFHNLTVNWDSLRTLYRTEIQDTVSRGRFSAILSHLARALREARTTFSDPSVYQTKPLPGVPLWYVGAWKNVGHFGAALTPLPDSSLLVYSVVDSHPLGLKRGDVVLGYDGRRWVDILRELQQAQLPIRPNVVFCSCSTAITYSLLNAAGLNWHLFDTIDIVEYSTGDTVHLPTSLLAGDSMSLNATDQMDIPGVLMPSGTAVSYGIVSGTRIGYIYCWGWSGDAEPKFYNAVYMLASDASVKGIIIDFRYVGGGSITKSNSGLSLLFRDTTETIEFTRRSDPNDHLAMRVTGPESVYAIPGNGVGYDKPIAVLVGPGALGGGEQVAFRMTFHPRVKTFGRSTNGAYNDAIIVQMPNGWYANYALGDARLASDSSYYLTHREFPVDVPVWHTRDAVARGEDTVVTAAMAWIDSTAGVTEELGPSAADRSPFTATIIRGALALGAGSGQQAVNRAELLNAAGMKVMDLHSGANDVWALAPGVYFILEELQALSHTPQAVRKVVLTR